MVALRPTHESDGGKMKRPARQTEKDILGTPGESVVLIFFREVRNVRSARGKRRKGKSPSLPNQAQ
jgi:hypothetical protein